MGLSLCKTTPLSTNSVAQRVQVVSKVLPSI